MTSHASPFQSPRPAVALIGAGAMARVLGLRLSEAGYPISAVVSRTRGSAESLARLLGAPVASDQLRDLGTAPMVILAVPDDQIADLAETLVEAPRTWRGTVVLHTSGAVPASALSPLAALGATTLAFHPIQTLPRGADSSALDGVTVGLEGEEAGRFAGVELAVHLGLRYVSLSAEQKSRYHLASAMASNLLVTLMGMVHEVTSSIGLDREETMRMLRPLLESTIENLSSSSPEDALTGPVARGDLGTLKAHGLALRQHLPHLVPAYAALSVETVRLAVRANKLSPERAKDVLSLMEKMVTLPLPAATTPVGLEVAGDGAG